MSGLRCAHASVRKYCYGSGTLGTNGKYGRRYDVCPDTLRRWEAETAGLDRAYVVIPPLIAFRTASVNTSISCGVVYTLGVMRMPLNSGCTIGVLTIL